MRDLSTSSGAPRRRNPLTQLWLWVVVGLVAGILVGLLAPGFGIQLQPLGTLFVNVIKAIVAPVVFCAIVSGIASVSDLSQVGKVGLRALIYFFAVTGFLMILGLVAAEITRPGAGLNIDIAGLDTSSLAQYTEHQVAGWDYVLEVVPTTLFSAFTEGNILSVLIVSLLFGIALKAVGDAGTGIARGIERFSKVVFKIVGWVLWLSPIGAFGALAYTVSKYSGAVLANLAMLILWFSVTALIVIVFLFGGITLALGLNPLKLVRYLREEVVIGLATVSGEAVLPGMLVKLERLGVDRPVVNVTLPAGYSFNLDGTALYMTFSILFMAQATGTHIGFGTLAGMVALLLILSKGSAGVPGGVLIVLASTMGGIVPVPVAALSLIVGVDRILSEGRTMVTVLGNAVGTLVVARWVGALDLQHARAVLDGRVPAPGSTASADAAELVTASAKSG
ncbi:cation:dicarboxylate symporter family transporter [Streptomyces shenzhenensis]|uniref:cation:dicarboxylate symporter family transporter n=1 Tax=Streptomyces shenzhenensis TaxID=943815 RepID=UPI0038136C5F